MTLRRSRCLKELFYPGAIFCILYIISDQVFVKGDEYEYVTPVFVTSYENRVKRSAKVDLPDNLHFTFPLSGQDVELKLKRRSLIPTVTSSGKEFHKEVQDSGVYVDMAKGSSMIVKRSSGEYQLRGTFNHENKYWEISPNTRNKRSTHAVSVQNIEAADMHGDAIMPETSYNPQIIDTRDENHYNKTADNFGTTGRVHHTIELSFVADNSDYLAFVNYHSMSSAIEQMRIWYSYIGNVINARYETIEDPDIRISTVVVKLLIFDVVTTENSFIKDLGDPYSGLTGIQAFRSWLQNHGQNILPTSDHYMYFTQQKMVGGAIGLAYIETVCSFYGISLNENRLQADLGSVCAHELGHSLSAYHDSTEGCDDQKQNIMAAIIRPITNPGNEGNKWRFSSCSKLKFKAYLTSRSCTLPANTNSGEDLPNPATGDLYYDRDEQCRQRYKDSRAAFCPYLQDRNNICSGLWCIVPEYLPEIRCSPIMPMQYTPCGDNKYCKLGLCVDVPPTHGLGCDRNQTSI